MRAGIQSLIRYSKEAADSGDSKHAHFHLLRAVEEISAEVASLRQLGVPVERLRTLVAVWRLYASHRYSDAPGWESAATQLERLIAEYDR